MDSTPLPKPRVTETLFPYQVEGAKWLSQQKVALLADEMGLGKTAQAITAADLIGAKRILVICPAIARINWQREFEKFSDRKREITLIRGEKTPVWPQTSIITSFDACLHVTDPGVFDLMIVDEWHFLKSVEAKRTGKIVGKGGLVHCAKRVWALTGTPAPNHGGELWSLLYTFGTTQMTYTQFIHHFCNVKKNSYRLQIYGTKKDKIPELQRLLSKIILRRKKEDVMKELPALNYSQVLVERGNVDLRTSDKLIFYHEFPEKLAAKLKAEQQMVEYIVQTQGTTPRGMRALEALAPSISTLRVYTGLQKVDPVVSLIADELESNAYDKVVIFAVHKDVINLVRIGLSRFGAKSLYGGTDEATRQKNLDRFQRMPKYRVMVCNIQAAGTAITLTAANQVVFLEQDWVPGNNAQAVMRCHRIGQTRPVFVRVFGLAESVDEHISNSLKRKMTELTRLFDFSSQSPKLTESNRDYNTLIQDKNEITDIEELLK